MAQDVIDTAVQFTGGNGIAQDLPLSAFYQDVCQFRSIDGADEVHKRTIAREAFVRPSAVSDRTVRTTGRRAAVPFPTFHHYEGGVLH